MTLGHSRTIFATLLFAAMIVSIADRVVYAAPDPKLLVLARGKFSAMTTAEIELLKFVGSDSSDPEGFAAAGPSAKPGDPSNDPAHADKWGKEREVRAQLIRWLCVDSRAKVLIDPQGIRLLGARITGKLNLSDVKVPFPLVLRKCSVAERMTFESAVFPRLELGGSYTGEIDGDGIVVQSHLDLNFLHASGEVRFPNSSIDGNFYATGSHFMRSKVEPQAGLVKGVALDLTSSTIRGFVVLCCAVEADGAVLLSGFTVSALFFTGGTFNNPNSPAISAKGIRVNHVVFLGSSPELGNGGVRINGLVEFPSAHVAESFIVSDATFSGAVGDLHGFDATGMSAAALLWQRVKLENGASMNLAAVTVGALIDDSASWPVTGKLRLYGLTYSQLVGFASDGRSPLDARSRLRWLALQLEFDAQPYRQLAKVLREQGDEPGATEVLIVSEKTGAMRATGAQVRYGADS